MRGGGAPSTVPSVAAQTFSSTITLMLDSAQLVGAPGTLEIGLTDPRPSGEGFSSLNFQIQVNGVTRANETFANLASANSYFTDNVLSLGAFPIGMSTINALLQVTTIGASDGYNVEFLVANLSPIPEPTSIALMAGAVLALGSFRRRQRD